mgnify:CR=1 FL=1
MTCINLRNTMIPQSTKGWLLIDDLSLPRYWATLWADVLRAHLAQTTRGAHLYAIERLYQITDLKIGMGSLDRMLFELDMPSIETALTTFLSTLRNDGNRRGINNNQAWASATSFVSDIVSHLSVSSEPHYGNIQSRLLRLDRLYSQVSPTRPRPPAGIRALPASVVEDLFEIFSPESKRNPFRSPILRWRNFLIFLLMLHLGLRRGEVAMLSSDAIKSDYDPSAGREKYWINITENPYHEEDPRFNAPSLKTANSRRQLPLSEEIVAVADVVQGSRRRAPHSYLLESQKLKPLSLRSIHRIFEIASEQLSPHAREILSNQGRSHISAHDLRHTCAVYRLGRYVALGDELDLASEKLRVFFGWSPSSPMPRHYARAYFESDSADIWSETYDRLVSTLRSIGGVLP